MSTIGPILIYAVDRQYAGGSVAAIELIDGSRYRCYSEQHVRRAEHALKMGHAVMLDLVTSASKNVYIIAVHSTGMTPEELLATKWTPAELTDAS